MKVKIFSFIIAILLLFLALYMPVSAENSAVMPNDSVAGQFALYNLNDESFVMGKELDTQIYPASTVKIMSGLIVCEELQHRVNETVTITSEMLSGVSGKTMGLSAGDRLSVKSLMYAAYSCGCNDAAIALSVIALGSTKSTVDRMNERAATLGMYSTVYTNVTGMDDLAMKSTLRDVVRLSVEASKNVLFTEVASVYSYLVEFEGGKTRRVYGTNELLNKTNFELYCKSVKALNAGETDKGGACVAVCGEYENKQFVAVALGCSSEHLSRFELIRDALDWVYKSAYVVAAKRGTLVGSVNVTMSEFENTRVGAVLSEPLEIYLKSGETLDNVRYSLIIPEEGVSAPVEEGSVIGRYNAWYGKELRGSAAVTVSEPVEKSAFLGGLDTLRRYITSRTFISTLISAAILSTVAVVFPLIALKSRQKRRKYVTHRGGFNLKK